MKLDGYPCEFKFVVNAVAAINADETPVKPCHLGQYQSGSHSF